MRRSAGHPTRRPRPWGISGGDLKYSVTPSLTLDLTYNTDFAQVEVDEEQINLDRFNLFFPEKRPFFLENAGLFSVGLPGQLEVFFSRRIGVGGDGEQIPIIGGGRLSGKVGNNTNIGFLNMQTESFDPTGAPSTNFTVARVRQDFANRSNVGVMFVNRGATGDLARDRDYNRSYAVDGRLGVGQAFTFSGFAASTDTPGITGDTHAYSGSANFESERYRIGGGFTEAGPNFNPEVGFFTRRGYRRMDAAFRTRYRPDNSWGIHELRPHASHNTIWNFRTGQQETQYSHIDNAIEWENGYEVSTAWNISKEGVLEPFENLPRRDRPDRDLSAQRGPAQVQYQSRGAGEPSYRNDYRRLLRGRPGAGGAAARCEGRRSVQHPAGLGLQRHRSAGRSLHDQPRPLARQLQLHAADVRPGACPVQRPC